METEAAVVESRRRLWLRIGGTVAVVFVLLTIIAFVAIRRTGRNDLEAALARARGAGFPIGRPESDRRRAEFGHTTGLDELGRAARAKGLPGPWPERRLFQDVRAYAEGGSGKTNASFALQIGKSILANAERATVDPRSTRDANPRPQFDRESAVATVWSIFLCARFRLRLENGDLRNAEADFRRLIALYRMSESQGGDPGDRGSSSYCDAWFRAIQFAANGSVDARFLQRLLNASRGLKVGNYVGALHHRLASMLGSAEQFRRGESRLPSSGRYAQPSKLTDGYYRIRLDEAEALVIDHAVDLAAAWPNLRQMYAARSRFLAKTKPNPVNPTPALARDMALTFGIRPDAALLWSSLEAKIRGGRIVLAAAILYRRNGRFPSLADAAVSAGVDSTDPFSGAPLVYKPVGGTLLVYGVGRNLIDDGGRSSRMSKLDDEAVCRLRLK